ncbi:type 4a pilus biogenesis protein PilO [Thalassotalea atypica]|uniref:type 4a pilus biogenesis protein PilO n=1 Tax=Thalassotalea atypica TaxID=2054316 RepID=UPI002572A014|nr:type 4a pilus biogenesis protein PilO [Thalassotalea atypica]
MNSDINQFLEQFNDLDVENIGQWPVAVKVVVAIFLSVVLSGLLYMTMVKDRIVQLESVAKEEIELKQQYSSKYYVAANLELFQQQMIEAETIFANQLRSLPESHETPGLLDDITFIGTTSGLDFVKLNWQPEITKEIYIELPIDIEVIGAYHDFGSFVSKIAGLPRIVTLHDFTIVIPQPEKEILNLKLQAKTYRYQEASEQ